MSEGGHELIIVRRHEEEEHEHHSSAWKVAHADFMTAMMAFFLIMWLAAWAATAAQRATFVVPVNAYGCSDDGSNINSKHCLVGRSLDKRGVILFRAGQAVMSAVAGVGALVW